MNSFVPSEVLARFRATSRKLFRPKFTFSDLIVSNCTSTFRRPFSSYSIPSVLRNSRDPIRRLGRKAEQPTGAILIFLTRREVAKTPTANRVTAALNSACSSSGRNGLLPLWGGVRRKLLPPLWRARGGAPALVRGPARSCRLAMPSVRHIVQRELLPAMRSPDGSLGGPAATSIQHAAGPFDPVDLGPRCVRRLRPHGLRRTRREPDPHRAWHPRHPIRPDGEQRDGLQRELDP